MDKYKNKLMIGLSFVLLFIVHQFIFPMGDDYYYGCFSHDWNTFLGKHIEHYMTVNGRALIHFIVSLFLAADVYVWRIINPVMILAVLWLIYKISLQGAPGNNNGFVICVILFFCFDIEVVRESVYWLDGSFNYLFSMLLVLLTYHLYTTKKYMDSNRLLVYILAFFSGATMEQTGIILNGLIIMDIIHNKFILKQKIHKAKIITQICALAGYLTVILAPGVFARFELNGAQSADIIASFAYLLNLTFYNTTMIYIQTAVLLICFKWLSDSTTRFNRRFRWLCFVPIAFYLLRNNFKLDEMSSVIITLHLIVIVTYMTVVGYTFIKKYIKEKCITELSLVTVAYGAQIMLTVTSTFGGRTLFPSIICLMIVILIGLKRYENNDLLSVFIILCVLEFLTTVKFIAIILFVVYKLFTVSNKTKFTRFKLHTPTAGIVLLCCFALISFSGIFIGYYKNSEVNRHNIASIEIFKHEKMDTLVLEKMYDDNFGVSFPYNDPYHMVWFKRYYGITDDIQIFYNENFISSR